MSHQILLELQSDLQQLAADNGDRLTTTVRQAILCYLDEQPDLSSFLLIDNFFGAGVTLVPIDLPDDLEPRLRQQSADIRYSFDDTLSAIFRWHIDQQKPAPSAPGAKIYKFPSGGRRSYRRR
jgi:hypothetical protein